MIGLAREELARFAGIVEARFGLRIEPEHAVQVGELVQRRAQHHREPVATYLERLAVDRAELRELAADLTVGETYFFRHAEQLAAFAEVATRGLATGTLRALSAGCASGEEPYTLAMLLHARAPKAAWQVHGVDLNPRALERAAAARYSRWSLRAMPVELEQRWFRVEGRDAILDPELRASVTFREANLLDPTLWPAGSWDIVFCRNVLMYFTDEHARAVIARIVRSLTPGGYLFLGHAETLRGRADGLELCHSHGTFYYQHGGGELPAIETGGAWYGDIEAASRRVHTLVDDALGGPSIAPLEPLIESPGPSTELDAIHALLADERFAEALSRITLLRVTEDREIALLHAVVLVHAGRIVDAEIACNALLALEPDSASAHLLIAQCRESAGDFAGAVEHAQLAIRFDPSFAMARLLLGLLARRTGQPAIASDELARAVVLFEREDPARLAMFGGGLKRAALVALCQAELARLRGAA